MKSIDISAVILVCLCLSACAGADEATGDGSEGRADDFSDQPPAFALHYDFDGTDCVIQTCKVPVEDAATDCTMTPVVQPMSFVLDQSMPPDEIVTSPEVPSLAAVIERGDPRRWEHRIDSDGIREHYLGEMIPPFGMKVVVVQDVAVEGDDESQSTLECVFEGDAREAPGQGL